ncbi:MFS general substrate transporter [Lophium mytilinum]|uniref:MFS general substrate transporter n=1 Tax=Lophium mytilinum TaxID=390894 RepID=A0A6A6R6G3_9PEZI|nr:MFS general substrate transporter [Lophium mytilinum]
MATDIKQSVASSATTPESEDVRSTSSTRNYSWFRGVFFNATIVGVAAFTAPGLWNAMQAVGAGGQQTPYLVMAGNAILFALMTLTCLSGSILANRFGLKAAFIFGTSGYVLYSAALYCNNRYRTKWFIYFGSAACGITAGVFWAAEGAIMLSYPEPKNRGKYLAYWLAYRNGGSIIGGVINLAFNYAGKKTGKLDWRTYIVFVVLQCFGPAVGCLLSPPEKVQRRNGTKVQLSERIHTKDEIKAVLKLLARKDFLLVVPFFIYVTWNQPYVSAYVSLYFTVRARALASLVGAVSQICATLIMGSFLDWQRFSLNTRAKVSYIAMMLLLGGCWVWGIVVQRGYSHHKPALDWNDSGFGRGWALYVFWQVNFALTYNYGYWLVGYMAKEHREIVRYTSVVRAVEAAGQCVASGISSTKTPLIRETGVNFALWGLAVIPTYLVVKNIGVTLYGADGEKDETPKLAEDGLKEVEGKH